MHIDLLVLNYLQNFDDNFEYKISNSNHCSGKKKHVILAVEANKLSKFQTFTKKKIEHETISVHFLIIDHN